MNPAGDAGQARAKPTCGLTLGVGQWSPLMDTVWDGVIEPGSPRETWVQIRLSLADAARDYSWPRVFELLSEHEDLINSVRPGGSSWYTPLHQAAHGGASLDVVQRLLGMGAFRTIQNAWGERPVDVAELRGSDHLVDVLAPRHLHHVPTGILMKLQEHFHSAIRSRANDVVSFTDLRLPQLEPLLELSDPRCWFPVPGMGGGFMFCSTAL